MDRYLTGKLMKVLPKVKLPTIYIEPIHSGDEEGEMTGRIELDQLPAAERWKNFQEVDLCVSEQQVQCEARRCLRCDIEFTQPA